MRGGRLGLSLSLRLSFGLAFGNHARLVRQFDLVNVVSFRQRYLRANSIQSGHDASIR